MVSIPKLINYTSATTTKDECRLMKKLTGCEGELYRSEYHAMICEKLKVGNAWSFSAGRAAIYSLLVAMGIGTGDEVIVQGYTCAVVPKAVIYTGAVPIYADTDRSDYNMDYDSFLECLSVRTKAVIVQHTYGVPCHNIFRIKEECKKRGLLLIEDCAHIFGNSWNGYILGTIGDAAIFSTDHTKYISTSIGGILITSDDGIAEKVNGYYESVPELPPVIQRRISRQFRWMNTISNKYIAWMIGCNKYARYTFGYLQGLVFRGEKDFFFMTDYTNVEFPDYVFPAKLSGQQAAVGISQIKSLDSNHEYRRKLSLLYRERLSEKFYIPDCAEAFLRLPLYVKDKEIIKKEFKNILRVEDWFNPALECFEEDYYDKIGYDKDRCPVSQDLSYHVINLPIHPKISVREVEEICDRLLALPV